MLIEKAYAKLLGSYGGISEGNEGDAMSDITGAPYKTLHLNNGLDGAGTMATESVDTFDDLQTALHKLGWIACASTPTQEEGAPDNLERKYGLISGHAYGVRAVLKVSTGEKLVLIQNPWRTSTTWTGKYANGDPRWTPALRGETARYSSGHPSVSWMTIEDFKKFFCRVTVLQLNDGWDSTSKIVTLTQKTCWRIHIEKDQKIIFSVHQRANPDPLNIRFCLVRALNREPVCGSMDIYIRTKHLTQIDASADPNMDLSTRGDDVFFQKGEYILMIEVHQSEHKLLPRPAIITAYAEDPSAISFIGMLTQRQQEDIPFSVPGMGLKHGYCHKCKGQLLEMSVAVHGHKYHEHCFVCEECKKPITGKFKTTRKGEFYCASCIYRMEHTKCDRCFKPLRGPSIKTASGQVYHEHCREEMQAALARRHPHGSHLFSHPKPVHEPPTQPKPVVEEPKQQPVAPRAVHEAPKHVKA